MRWAFLLTVLFLRIYDPTTNLQSSPPNTKRWFTHDLSGSFGVRHTTPGRTRLMGQIEALYHDHYRMDGVRFEVGGQVDLAPRWTLELRHGSWHTVDGSSRVEKWNYAGIEVKL